MQNEKPRAWCVAMVSKQEGGKFHVHQVLSHHYDKEDAIRQFYIWKKFKGIGHQDQNQKIAVRSRDGVTFFPKERKSDARSRRNKRG